ncbi:Galectin [Aphelenchoides bicaudatus]|nr:Galectin [Aphelenchoides bicaudatus]
MAAIIQKILSLWHRKKALTRKDSITGRNHTFPVPYLAKLEGDRIQPGQSLILRGIIKDKEDFIISLTNGPKVEFDEETQELNDRLLYIRVDVQHKKIFLNACINNEWGKEGVIKHNWKVGSEFDIRLRGHDDEFEIFIDHKLSARFAHYQPLDKITHIFATGAIELYTSEWTGTYYPVPYAADIPDNLYPRRRFYISGLVTKKAKQFVIDFLSGQDVALRIDSRFPAKKVICNTRQNEEWGQEQIIKPFPFRRAKAFDLLIYVDESKFIIYNDDCLVGTFEHRINPRTCDKIQINGDVVLQAVHIK